MLIYRAATRSYQLAAPKGIAIGFNEGPIFDKNIQQMQTTLNPGDSILLYTDGFPEAMNEENEEFGDDEFYDLVGKAGHLGAKGLVTSIVEQIAQHRGEAAQSDDLTALALAVKRRQAIKCRYQTVFYSRIRNQRSAIDRAIKTPW